MCLYFDKLAPSGQTCYSARMNAPFFRIAQASVGSQLRAARKAAGLSRPDLSRLTEISVETIAATEKSGRGQVSTLLALLHGLRCRIAGQPHGLVLGEWLRALRHARGMGQRDAARIAMLTQPTIGGLEISKGQIASLSKLLAAFGVPLRLVLVDGPVPSPVPGRRLARGESYDLFEGDCRERMKALIDEGRSFHSMVTDPPYEMNHLGKAWDRSSIAFDVETWRLCYDLLRPGAFAVVFAWPKTAHRVAVALEDAGFELKDTLAWIHNSGVPWGSKDISRGMDAHFGAAREVTGTQPKAGKASSGGSARLALPGGYAANLFSGLRRDRPVTEQAVQWSGFRTRLKPAREDILLIQRPLSESTYERNILRWGVGALNVDAVRVPSTCVPHMKLKVGKNGFDWRPSDKGRYPPNLVLGAGFDDCWWQHHYHVAKPVGKARWGHPCAKPVQLLIMLARLCCPPGGMILDPYAGCASAGEAALRENFGYVGLELDPIYANTARQRLDQIATGEAHRA